MKRVSQFLIISFSFLIFVACGNKSLTSYVNPLVGTDGHGHTFPGAIVPFGQIQSSPDTRLEGWDGCSGYHYSDDTIYGFSHTHLSGTGCSDYGDLLLMPVCGQWSGDYKSHFSHKNETARAGYYKVLLDGPKTIVELTADRRVAYHAYTYADDRNNAFVIELNHRDVLISGKIMLRDGMIVGWRESSAWNPDQHLHFAIRGDVDLSDITFNEDSTQAVVKLPDGTKRIELQVAISGVDIDGAIGNLITAKHNDFESARRAADRTWEEALGKLKVEGGSKEQRRCFYTALYHCMTSPYLWSDADGRYRGTDNKIHVADEGREVYTVFSLWDTYRALHPLLTQIEPERTVDFVYTAMKNFEQGGELPMWELASYETHCMIGYHAVPMMLEAYIHLAEPDGTIAGYSPNQLLAAMVATSNRTPEQRAYAAQGYLSSEVDNESVSKTLEYAYDDWCIAQMADFAGDTAVAREYWIRSQSWQNVIDSNGFAHAKRNGGWVTPFDPTEVNNHFTEANSWQYSTYVPHDIAAWVEHIGGKNNAVAFLDSLFEGHNAMGGRDQVDVTGLIGMYAHGNEPSHHAAWLYSLLGQPEKTEKYVHKILDEFYSSQPDGLCGNEDCGQMSAWYVLASLGMYKVCPGSDIWVETKPIFNVDGFKRAPLTVNMFYDCPDSLRITPCPVFDDWRMQMGEEKQGEAMVYTDKEVQFFSPSDKSGKLYPVLNCLEERRNVSPFAIMPGAKEVDVEFAAQIDGRLMSQVVKQHLVRTSTDKHVTYLTQPAPQYTENGPEGMVDNIYGNTNYRIGGWQGWQGDMVAVVELDNEQKVSMVGVNCLENMRSWIFYPKSLKVEYSLDGENWLPYGDMLEVKDAPGENPQSKQEKSTTQLFAVVKQVRAKYFKLTVENYGTLPDWHISAGEQAWIFADEIVIL
ncbi:MAG: GH92 family glycosyl hydrolase [Bacteroidales bacterium]|nr:GH92 family glycosyl hydrolase [Bacteroidales bacterium]